MMRVGRALVRHEFQERIRDRWVAVVSIVFMLMASGVTLYSRNAAESAITLTGPSLVTLASMLVPLVALILGHDVICGERDRHTLGLLLSLPASAGEIVFAKVIGRVLALSISVSLGLGAAIILAEEGTRGALVSLVWPTVLLGAAFLTLGTFLSAVVKRPGTAASLAVVVWFLLVFFYDLGLLGLLVLTDGAFPSEAISGLVAANPAGLYRVEMMAQYAGPTGFEDLSIASFLPARGVSVAIWVAWTFGLTAVTALTLTRQRSLR